VRGHPRLAADDRVAVVAVCAGLLLAVALVFGQTVSFQFLNVDDADYVTENPLVRNGLTVRAVERAFTERHSSNWHPLTWLSLMVDCQFFGLDPAACHATNVLLHAATAVALFLVLRGMTGSLWRSALVAAVFAVHPLRAESVAWVSERKDVLSGFFFVIALGAYGKYVKSPSLARYLVVVVLYAMGLTAKPMLVTFPGVILLLDYWPLKRFEPRGTAREIAAAVRRLTIEKIPLMGLAAASCLVTLWAQRESVVAGSDTAALPWRLGNAVTAYVGYLKNFAYPAELSPFYPHSGHDLGLGRVAACCLVLLAITVVAAKASRRRPYLLVGWLWYLGALLPVIGIIQVSDQAMADRYTLLPQMGLTVSAVWLAAELVSSWAWPRGAVAATAGAYVLALGVCAAVETTHWKDSVALWRHAVTRFPGCYKARMMLGDALQAQGDTEGAITQFLQGTRIEPQLSWAYTGLGPTLAKLRGFQKADDCLQTALRTIGDRSPYQRAKIDLALASLHFDAQRLEEAASFARQALNLRPDLVKGRDLLAAILLKQGKLEEAASQYQAFLQLVPSDSMAHQDLAVALEALRRPVEAEAHYQTALECDPGNVEARLNYGQFLMTRGDARGAMRQYREALKTAPQRARAHALLGMALLEQASPDEAADFLARAAQLMPDDPALPKVLDALAMAYAMDHRIPEAIRVARKAAARASELGQTPLLHDISERLRWYESRLGSAP
jgi:tetratricopeptide (TPR) repeat protein